MAFWTWLGDNRNQSVAQVPELWMACGVSEVVEKEGSEHRETHLCSYLTLDPHADSPGSGSGWGVNTACPKVGGPPILSKAALRLGRGKGTR